MSDASLIEGLLQMKHDEATLLKAGYKLTQLSHQDIEDRRRCVRCGSTAYQRKKRAAAARVRREKQKASKATEEAKVNHVGKTEERQVSSIRIDPKSMQQIDSNSKLSEVTNNGKASKNEAPERHGACRYHPGQYVKSLGSWSCCQGELKVPFCASTNTHSPIPVKHKELVKQWQVYPTPPSFGSQDIRSVVAIDCEMGKSITKEPELLRVSLFDVVGNETLLDKLVYPDIPIRDYCTRYSGITIGMMENARKKGNCLIGKEMARKHVWRYVGPSTLVIGHSAHNDLQSLRWIHTHVLDTKIVAAKLLEEEEAKDKAVKAEEDAATKVVDAKDNNGEEVVEKVEKADKPKKGEGKLSLKGLSAVHLDRAIQESEDGHDSVEDARASADLAIHFAAQLHLS